jgi:prepilin-type N-terminal cleavage/methylation domain-containing protein
MIRNSKGYTLIELIVVVVLIGLTLTLTIPRFRDTLLTDDLKTTTRKMVGMINNLRNDAISEQRDYILRFDLGLNRIWIDSPAMNETERTMAREKAFNLAKGVRILDIQFKGEEKTMAGETGIRVNKRGYVQPSVIHLRSEDEKGFTLVLRPFLGRVNILENYVDIEDL